MKILVTAIFGLFTIGMLVALPSSYADAQTSTMPLGEGLNLEMTTITMIVPENNEFPWGHVRGSVDNPAIGHPVIIQFYKGDDPVHVAQVGVDSDNTYDYKFRVRNMVDGQAVNIFEGSYEVKVFKVVKDGLNTI